jgi:hypothetical protein
MQRRRSQRGLFGLQPGTTALRQLHERSPGIVPARAHRALVNLALPIILTNILQTGYGLTDAFWVGRPAFCGEVDSLSLPGR